MKRRVGIRVTGRVQGVGFRPTVYRLATAHRLNGWVRNDPSGVRIEVEGEESHVEAFCRALREAPPPQARIVGLHREELAVLNESGFRIVPSSRSGDLLFGLPPDLATCADCLHELENPKDRRYRYPFINCTNCGPRFTVACALPYDRERTSMAGFRMCTDCAREFADPGDRRFDAQLDACPVCGPRLTLVDHTGAVCPGAPMEEAVRHLRAGHILAVKGVGGYHLCCLATDDCAVSRLRERKHRPHKAVAVMFRSLAQARTFCLTNTVEEHFLCSPARPIVILNARSDTNPPLSRWISPDTRDVGAFLPYTPLHHMLLAEVGPLVMTSGNRAEEPIARDERELCRILGTIADYALTHDRPIVRRCDDSVLRVVDGVPLFVRRSRGYVPERLALLRDTDPSVGMPPVFGCGADLKNTVCLSRGPWAFVSQHIGDLTDQRNVAFFQEAVEDFCRLLGVQPTVVAHDAHPDYVSTRQAERFPDARRLVVQHHHAHIAAVLAEYGLEGPVIGVVLDGLGLGTDRSLWGGEFLVADRCAFRRLFHFKPYRLPGGDAATEHPERMAYSCLLTEGEGDEACVPSLLPGLDPSQRALLRRMVMQGIRSPWTTSAGRLFDAVSAILGLCSTVTYEAQAAIRLEAAAAGVEEAESYGWRVHGDTLDFGPALREIVADRLAGRDVGLMAARFHETLCAASAEICERIRQGTGRNDVALAGGCFQNARLLRRLRARLLQKGFRVFVPERIPPNDGGISLGQVAVAVERLRTGRL